MKPRDPVDKALELLESTALNESEVYVDAEGYATDDEGNKWYDGRPEGTYLGTAPRGGASYVNEPPGYISDRELSRRYRENSSGGQGGTRYRPRSRLRRY